MSYFKEEMAGVNYNIIINPSISTSMRSMPAMCE